MRSPTKQDSAERRSTEHRAPRSETVRAARPAGTARAAARARDAEAAPTPKTAVVTSMVDALEDILKWERASERAMRVATEQSTTELDPSN